MALQPPHPPSGLRSRAGGLALPRRTPEETSFPDPSSREDGEGFLVLTGCKKSLTEQRNGL